MMPMSNEEKLVKVLIILPASHLAMLDAMRDRLSIASRGKLISTLLDSVVNIYPASMEIERRPKPLRRKVTA